MESRFESAPPSCPAPRSRVQNVPIDVRPVCEHAFVPRFTEDEAREAIAASTNVSEALRHLGLCPTGGSHQTLKIWAERWGISTKHFDPDIARHRGLRRPAFALEEVLVEHSSTNRNSVKNRLYREGLKERACEECGQGEMWRGRRMGLILDHINGVRDDNRLENLRIVCPNCAATFDTHCGRKNRMPQEQKPCALCGTPFWPNSRAQKYCSRDCGQRSPSASRGVAQPGRRRVERPRYLTLITEIADNGYSAVGRKYGVSDNAIRKWRLQYEREAGLRD